MAELQRAVAHVWVFKMVDEDDFATAKTGITPAVTKSEDGNAFASLNGAPAATEISSGWYKITVPAVDMTADVVVLRATGALCAPTEEKIYLQTTINSDLNDFDPTADAVANVTLVATTTDVTNDVNADVVAISTSGPAANNLETAALAYSAERGLSGIALPAVVAGGAGGLPISGVGLDADTLATATALASVKVDTGTTIPTLIGTPSVDVSTDIAAVKTDTGNIVTDTGTTLPDLIGTPTVDLATDIGNIPDAAGIKTQADAALTDIHLDHLLNVPFDHGVPIGDPLALWNVMTEADGGGSGSPQFTSLALENGPAGGAANDRHEVLGSCVQDDDGKLYWCAWMEKNGKPQIAVTDCRIDTWLLDGDGTITDLSLTERVLTPDAHGMFNGTLTPTIESGMKYKLRAIITYSGTDYTGFIPFASPVRATA